MIERACTVCGRISDKPRCPEHRRKPWDGARHGRGPGWTRRRARILARDQGICHVCGQPGADEVDHVIPLAEGGPDTDENCAAIHGRPCHADKTQREALRGRLR